ncbi:MAG: PAAR domain-containing protein [Anaerolineae bacterium]|nr:PAAR domain-containing protein [Anaerolineae bacterium]
MGQPAAKQGDSVVGVDIHIIMIPSPSGAVPTPLPHPFNGKIMSGCSTDVKIQGMGAATKDSVAVNNPPHIPQGGPFQKPPSNQGKVLMGSTTVFINGKPAARVGDQVVTCNDPTDAPTCTIIPPGTLTVLIG